MGDETKLESFSILVEFIERFCHIFLIVIADIMDFTQNILYYYNLQSLCALYVSPNIYIYHLSITVIHLQLI